MILTINCHIFPPSLENRNCVISDFGKYQIFIPKLQNLSKGCRKPQFATKVFKQVVTEDNLQNKMTWKTQSKKKSFLNKNWFATLIGRNKTIGIEGKLARKHPNTCMNANLQYLKTIFPGGAVDPPRI